MRPSTFRVMKKRSMTRIFTKGVVMGSLTGSVLVTNMLQEKMHSTLPSVDRAPGGATEWLALPSQYRFFSPCELIFIRSGPSPLGRMLIYNIRFLRGALGS